MMQKHSINLLHSTHETSRICVTCLLAQKHSINLLNSTYETPRICNGLFRSWTSRLISAEYKRISCLSIHHGWHSPFRTLGTCTRLGFSGETRESSHSFRWGRYNHNRRYEKQVDQKYKESRWKKDEKQYGKQWDAITCSRPRCKHEEGVQKEEEKDGSKPNVCCSCKIHLKK